MTPARAALVLPLVLAACGGPRYAWVNPDADNAQRAADRSYCQGAAELAAGWAYTDDRFTRNVEARAAWERCMRERGWRLEPVER